MQIGTIGLNHKSAPIAMREYFSEALLTLSENPEWKDVSFVPFSTCNRSEIIFSSSDVSSMHIQLLSAFRDAMPVPFEHHLYTYFGRDSFLHLARVTSGLDSALVGECEIQRQVKKAYDIAKKTRYLSREMHFVFQKSFKIAKGMRTRFCMERWGDGIPHIIWDLLKEREATQLLFIGYSDINRKIMNYLHRKKVQFTVVTKADALPYPSLRNLPSLSEYDAIISGTNAPQPIIKVEKAHEAPSLLIDLGVPRNIDPQLADFDKDVYNIDQLSGRVQQKRAESAAEITLCSQGIKHLVDRHTTLFFIHSKPHIRMLHNAI